MVIEHYDAVKYGKCTFPFRMRDFSVSPDMAKAKLGWAGPSCNLEKDLQEYYYDGYIARGGPTKELDLTKDLEIIKAE